MPGLQGNCATVPCQSNCATVPFNNVERHLAKVQAGRKIVLLSIYIKQDTAK